MSELTELKCCKCKEMLDPEGFRRNKRYANRLGRNYTCKDCEKKDPNRTKKNTIYMNKWRKKFPKRRSEHKEKWKKSNKIKISVSQKVCRAVKSGEITRLPCQVCGKAETQAHHDDYSKPLVIDWFCPLHRTQHFKKMMKLGAIIGL